MLAKVKKIYLSSKFVLIIPKLFLPLRLSFRPAQMAESVDALVSNTSGFISMPVRPRLWVLFRNAKFFLVKDLAFLFYCLRPQCVRIFFGSLKILLDYCLPSYFTYNLHCFYADNIKPFQ